MALVHESEHLDRLNALGPEELIAWAYTEYGERAGIITSFQNTGCVMIDMAGRVAPQMRVMTVDTLRLPDETYAFMDTVEKRYGISIERFKPDPERVQRMIDQHGEYLFFDSKPKQEYCCRLRKVEPNQRALETVDVWITGLRRDQSNARKQVDKASIVTQGDRRIIKLAPLVDWTEEEVRDYIAANDVPYNPLYDMGYTSIGCKICTTPTKAWEDKRAGRWRWFNEDQDGGGSKECGIHLGGSGI
jgi:phosphoadenylyl-sulfate reductase (thioredoxin)